MCRRGNVSHMALTMVWCISSVTCSNLTHTLLKSVTANNLGRWDWIAITLIYTTCLFCVTQKATLSTSSVLQFSLFSQSSETLNGSFGCDGSSGGELISTTCDLLVGTFAKPDAYSLSFDTVLSAEWRNVFGVLTDLKLLDDLSQGGTIPGSILSADSYLLCSLCHYVILYLIINNKIVATNTPIMTCLFSFSY